MPTLQTFRDPRMSGFEQRAHELLTTLLAGRHLPPDMRLAIEQAIVMQMRDGFTPAMESELRHFIDRCAEPVPPGSGDLPVGPRFEEDDRSTSVDVHWTTLR
ncbi:MULTISPECIES: hypothetical protein [unclassified Methylibium]|uniref:hypothetical protein n=1 Tax=unclassified Methylibium TaxID=2633235 RepID=UPI0004B4F5B5|nr:MULTISPECIES: hypothetical protein [unclassified Methylibium]